MKVAQISNNHFEIETSTGVFFQSYKTIVASRIGGMITVYPKYNYSPTTVRHLSKWLGINAKALHQMVDNGTIKVSTEPCNL